METSIIEPYIQKVDAKINEYPKNIFKTEPILPATDEMDFRKRLVEVAKMQQDMNKRNLLLQLSNLIMSILIFIFLIVILVLG